MDVWGILKDSSESAHDVDFPHGSQEFRFQLGRFIDDHGVDCWRSRDEYSSAEVDLRDYSTGQQDVDSETEGDVKTWS